MNPQAPSSPLTLKGYKGIVELSPEREGDPQSGNRTVRRFQGPESYLLALVPSIRAAKGRWRLSHTVGQPLASIMEASFPDLQDGTDPDDPDQIQELWFFDVEELQVAIRNTPEFNAIPLDGEKDSIIEYMAAPSYDNYPVLISAEAVDIADLVKAGQENVLRRRIIIRRTMSISQENTNLFNANVDKKYTLAQMLATFDITPAIAADMPAGEYLDKGTKKELQPNGRVQATTEWAHATKWADVFYPYAL